MNKILQSPARSASCSSVEGAQDTTEERRGLVSRHGGNLGLELHALLILHGVGARALVLGRVAAAATVVEDGDVRRWGVGGALAREGSLSTLRAEERGRDGGGAGALDGGAAAGRHLHHRVEGRGGADESESNELGGVHAGLWWRGIGRNSSPI